MRLAKLVVKLEMIKREGVELVLIDCLREDRLRPRMGWGLLVSPLYLRTFQVLGKPGEGPEGSGHWDPLLSEISSSLCGRVSVGVEWISGETKSASQRQQAPSCCEKIDGAVISLCQVATLIWRRLVRVWAWNQPLWGAAPMSSATK